MNKYVYIFVIALIIIVGVFLAYSQKPAVTPTVQQPSQTTSEININIANFSFSPNSVTVQAGTKITWTNEDSVAHQIASDTFSSDILNKGQSFSTIISTKGVYNYHCSIHPSMTGKITVE